MLRKSFRLVAVLGALTIAAAASSAAQAQSVGHINYALRIPDYRNATAVGRHLAFSLILTNLISIANDAKPPRPCRIDLSEAEFPDLLIPSLTEGGADWRLCLQRIDDILRRETFTQSAFDAALAASLRSRPWAPDDRAFSASDMNPTRERIQLNLELALRQLFPNDPVLAPILTYYDWVSREGRSYAGFTAWLASQRSAERFGLYSSSGPPDMRRVERAAP